MSSRLCRTTRKRPLWRMLCGVAITTSSASTSSAFWVPVSNHPTRWRGSRLFSTNVPSLRTSAAVVDLAFTDFSSSTSSSTTQPPPVLLLHGLLGNRKNFASIGRSLATSNPHRRITALDMRNHGDNNEVAESMKYTDMAQDVVHFLNQHDMDQAVLVGHSMGGKVAQAVALQAPERVEGLVVLDIAPVRYTEKDPHWQAVVDILQVLDNIPSGQYSKKEVEPVLQPSIPDPALRSFLLTNWNDKEKTWKIPINVMIDQLDELAAFDLDPEKHTYPGDVFFIHGGQSRFVRHSYMPRIGEYFPNHLLTTIRGAGHWVHAEAPQDTTALLQRFLDR